MLITPRCFPGIYGSVSGLLSRLRFNCYRTNQADMDTRRTKPLIVCRFRQRYTVMETQLSGVCWRRYDEHEAGSPHTMYGYTDKSRFFRGCSKSHWLRSSWRTIWHTIPGPDTIFRYGDYKQTYTEQHYSHYTVNDVLCPVCTICNHPER